MDRTANLLLILQRVKHRNTHVLDAIKQIEALYGHENPLGSQSPTEKDIDWAKQALKLENFNDISPV